MHRLLVRAGDAFMIRPENKRYTREAVEATLAEFARKGHSFEVRDTSGADDAERFALYNRYAVAAAGSGYRVDRVFGSDRHPGVSFGRGVPALVLFTEVSDQVPVDVYPHEERSTSVKTNVEFLDELF
jgi:hypothetical protein